MKIAKFKIPVSLKNRKALAIACIIVSLVVGFVLMPLASTAATVTVVRAKQDIPLGAQITKSMVETVKVGRKNLPSNVLRNFSDVVGKYSAVTITSGDYITSAKLNTTGSTYDLSSGQLLISVTVKNFADSLSGKLQSGDIVSVLFPPAAGNSLSSAAETDADCPPELQYVKVVTVTNANGGDTDEKTVKKAASSGSNSDNLPATVTLLVNERQAQILAGQESNTVHFALACRGNEKKADNLLKTQAEYFVTHSADSSSSGASASSQSSGASQAASSSQSGGYLTSSENLDQSANLGAVQ